MGGLCFEICARAPDPPPRDAVGDPHQCWCRELWPTTQLKWSPTASEKPARGARRQKCFWTAPLGGKVDLRSPQMTHLPSVVTPKMRTCTSSARSGRVRGRCPPRAWEGAERDSSFSGETLLSARAWSSLQRPQLLPTNQAL